MELGYNSSFFHRAANASCTKEIIELERKYDMFLEDYFESLMSGNNAFQAADR